jgi:hemerythrin-like domain-containing protein
MKTKFEQKHDSNEPARRTFLRNGFITMAGVAGMSLVNSCNKEKEEEVTPSEDLMREHGLLSRILFIYDNCKSRLLGNESFNPDLLANSARIIRTFVEDYHEKLEEDFLFPRFSKARQLNDLVQILYMQHHAGRVLTDQIIQTSGRKTLSQDDTKNLITLIGKFNTMYRPHKSREDTVLFPAIHKVVPESEYRRMGDRFEEKEKQKFGQDGFESMVDKVSSLEKQLGMYDLDKYTPVS